FLISDLHDCLRQLEQLLQEDGFREEAAVLAPILSLKLMCHVCLEQKAEARATLSDMVALVEREPEAISQVWNWEHFRNAVSDVEDEAIREHLEFVLGLLDTLAECDREHMLERLRTLQQQLELNAEPEEELPGAVI